MVEPQKPIIMGGKIKRSIKCEESYLIVHVLRGQPATTTCLGAEAKRCSITMTYSDPLVRGYVVSLQSRQSEIIQGAIGIGCFSA